MGLKCSLLGHDYGELEVERAREERGSQVVVTAREVETCRRCGKTRVVSENKEVTTRSSRGVGPSKREGGTSPDEVTDQPAGPPEGRDPDRANDDAPGGRTPPDGARDTDVQFAAGPDADREDDAAPTDASVGTGGEAFPQSAEEDDGIILDDGDDDRDPGEWPDDDDDAVTSAPPDEPVEGSEPIDPEATDGPVDVEAAAEADDGVEIMTDSDAEPSESEEAPAESPTSEASSGTDAERPGTTGGLDVGADRVDPDRPVTGPDGEFYCEDCGFVEQVAESPLRAGDICPECREGYLDRRATRKG